jgi:hypothetical protein
MLGLRRQLHYLVSRERRGCQTAYDEVAHSDVDALARAIHLVPENEVRMTHTTFPTLVSMHHL